uniref:Carboxylesterase n=1 Tax=Locusta migratoria TaxID=7004 RepID=W8E8K1_LOCMI|nr:carboxylesterase [Locusta migratoria]
METRTWIFVALLAAACVSLIQAEDEELPPNNIAETDTGSNDNAEETNPNAEETNPNAEGTNPNAEETNPNAEETNLAGPADNNTGVQDDNQEGDQGSSSGPSITTSASSSETTTEEVETVTKKEFDIIGVRMKSYLGRNFNAFCGIPYAEPPINKRRFKNPVPMTYDGTIDATNCEETPVCMQMRWHLDETEVIGVEDCLFLNVYEPEVTSSNLPVIVYIHGGGFFSGSGTFNDVGPHYFMDQDIVLVTINYRLGPLGFWGTNTHNAPNNLGLRDQVLALEWVRHYIGHFRGDKYRVTLMGEGAGGASVQLHLYSSMSRHLFHRAISQSGVAFNSWALMKDMVTPSYTHASIIGCFETTEARLLRCMQTVDAAIIVNTTAGLRSWLSEPLVIYRPAVQSRFGHDEIFLKKEIMHYLMTNNFHNVPWLVGTVNTPSFFHLQRYLKDEKLRSSLLGKFQQFGAKMLDLDASIADPMKLETAFKIISAAYSDSTGKLDKDGIVQIFNDREGNLGLMLTVAYHALLGHKNLYLYRFEYRAQHSMAENITGVKKMTW